LHRSIEASFTERVLRLVFAEPSHFAVHPALASCVQLADEGDANHLRLTTSARTIHAFAWGRGPLAALRPRRHPARQTLEASQAIARLHGLAPQDCVFPQQHPDGIDAGAFHTDVLAVASGPFLMLHDLAFTDATRFVDDLRRSLGEELFVAHASNAELPVARAIAAYPFNSQVIGLPDGSMTIVAPADAREDAASRAFLERVADAGGPVRSVHYVDVRQSMQNGGGPACLRLRVPLAENEASSLRGRVRLDAHLYRDLCAWVERWYRDRLSPDDLADPALAREGMEALDELTKILALGSLYDFQHG
jgi:succinylarginine dihydrolase